MTGEAGARLLGACVALADTLEEEVEAAGVLELLTRLCVELVGVQAATLLLADDNGALQVAAASGEHAARLLGPTERTSGECPGLDCYRDGAPVTAPDLGRNGVRWPVFAHHALHHGYAAAFALPLRRQEEVIGALTLFRTAPGPLSADASALAQALADATTVGVLQRRARHRHELLSAQLQSALRSRILVEQAKGALAERWNIPADDAFTILRHHARTRRTRLSDLAQGVIDRTVELPREVPR
ncbi:GAF and ANTAR domain-containing protein [Streptomyces sp.]|uniref:GAF and ANTAR domain-containing protein n=1 Tax=Streptomyces sp. TaxID=1931 RepID=UPI002F3EFB49